MKSVYEIHCDRLVSVRSTVIGNANSVCESVARDVIKAYADIMMGDHSADTAAQVSEVKARIANEKVKFKQIMRVLQSASETYSSAEGDLAAKAMIGTLIIRNWEDEGVGAANAYFRMELSPEEKRALSLGLLPVQFDSNSFHTVSEQTKDEYIRQHEQMHPEDGSLLDEILSDADLTDAERRDIKFLAYSAPEPYRTIYLEHLKEYSVDFDSKYDGSWYNNAFNNIRIERDEYNSGSMDLYETYFHESGHAVDDYEDGWGLKSNEYRFEGKSLHDHIVDDVRQYVGDVMRERYPELNEEDYRQLLKSINLTDDASFSADGDTKKLPGRLTDYRDDLIDYMRVDLNWQKNSSASDVYGGVTNNVLNGGAGHYGDYYWYGLFKGSTGNQENELWAEFFAAKMTHDEVELRSIRRHFPNAYRAMEEMAQQMANN